MAVPLAAGDAAPGSAPDLPGAQASRPWLPVDAPPGEAVMRKTASYPLPPAPGIDLDDPRAVLAHVLKGLASDVSVLPTENYLYWRFHTEDKEIWGNVRLGPGSRDKGRMFIGYYEFREDLTGPEEAHPRYAELGPGDGLDIRKLDDFLYDVSYRGSTVRFALNRVPQEAPRSLGPDEVFVFRTHDESGVQFHLLFNRRSRNFLFVANEEEKQLGQTLRVGDRLALDTGTGFLFYVDAEHGNRKILLGVYRRNVAQNNYYDGPADQLADNYIAGAPQYKDYLHQAYPFTRGVIDDYGFYLLDPANRVAVAPYYAYTSLAEVSSMLQACSRFANVGDLLACMIPGGFHTETDGDEGNPFAGVPGIPGLAGLPGAGQTPLATPAQEAQEAAGGALAGNLRPIHAALITWHLDGQTFIPPGSKHAAGLTWHIQNATFVPAGAKHAAGISWHIAGQTFIPAGSKHAAGITWHIQNATFIPAGSKHAAGISWHIAGQTFIPAGSKHAAGITWHIQNATFVPAGAKHAAGISWHIAGQTFIPAGSKHAAGITWHIGGQSFIPAGSIHAARITWHIPNASFIPAGSKHAAGITWHIGGQTFIPAGSIHAAGTTWHIGGQTFIPAGSVHAAGITWHIGGQSFIPAGSKHAAGITWHLANQSFIPPNAKHMSLITWHHGVATFLLASAGVPGGGDPDPQWEACVNGSCTQLACLTASCNPEDGNCEWTPTPGVACNDGDPYTLGDQCDDYGSCLGSTPVGSPCDDGNACTAGDAFGASGACVGEVQVGLACSDGNPCTVPGSGSCDAQGLCVGNPWIGAQCNDGDLCNVNDLCDATGDCRAQEDFECDDLHACNGEEVCDPARGCLAGVPPGCGDACAGETGTCQDPFGCVNEVAPTCEPGVACMTTECDPILGTCTEVPLDCDDGNPCTLDLCQAVDGASVCSHPVVGDGTSCDDDMACSTGTVCSAGTCGGGSWLETSECAGAL